MRRGEALVISWYGGADIGTMASVNKLFMVVVKMAHIPCYNATENLFRIQHVLKIFYRQNTCFWIVTVKSMEGFIGS